jgi:hypothetical protein
MSDLNSKEARIQLALQAIEQDTTLSLNDALQLSTTSLKQHLAIDTLESSFDAIARPT